MSLDPYQELGVPRDATGDEIKAAHRRGVRKHHPDAGGAPEKFGALQKSYEILVDPDKRKRYDETGATENATASQMEARVLEGVNRILIVAINDAMDLDTTDVRAVIEQILASATEKISDAIRDQERKIRRIDILEKRFKRRGRRGGKKATDQESTMLRLALRGQRQEAVTMLKKIEEDGAIHMRVVGVFEAFDYEFSASFTAPQGVYGRFPGFIDLGGFTFR